MKKYIIKYADGRECSELKSSYKSRNEASNALMEYIYNHNEYLNISDDDFLSIFDFKFEEVECTEVNETITDFKSARKALGLESNVDFELVGHFDKFDSIVQLISDINPMHIETLIALNELFTIAQAWNKEDDFVPDLSNRNQWKWYPWFKYDKDAAGLVYAGTNYTATHVSAHFGSRLCFKTPERAEQFGKQFIDLWNDVLFKY